MVKKRKYSRLILATAIAAGILVGLTLGIILAVSQDLPQIQALEDFQPGASTRIIDSKGRLLAEIYQEKRTPLDLEEIPQALRLAVVSVEDRRFHNHPGLDVIRNVGALIRDIQAGKFVQGGSTITQQLARNLFLTSEKTISRKLKEIFLALQIERRYTKDEILKLYLNQIYFGAGAYGVGAASELYFGKRVSELSLDESALLAGLPQSPEGYKPFKYPKRALARRRIVLRAMVRDGHITARQAAEAAKAPLKLASVPESRVKAPYFVRHVKSRLIELFGEDAVYRSGLTVITTLDMELQAAAEDAIDYGLGRLKNLPNDSGSSENAMAESPEAALVAMEVGGGGILAFVGGSDFKKTSLNRVADSPKKPAAAFQPLIYAAAVESGLTQADLVWDAPVSYPVSDENRDWSPRNYGRNFEGEITLRRAMEISGNIPAVKTLSRIGLDNFIASARKMGLTSPLDRNLTLAEGNSPVSLLELVSAYNALADNGLYVRPYAIKEVRDRSGRIIYRAAPQRRLAVSPETAYIITDMLRGVVMAGTAQRAQALGREVAGKTGTAGDHKDAFFIGYSPEITAGVWTGFESGGAWSRDRRAARTALPIWVDFMDAALKGKPVRKFDRPAGITMAYMDRFTGAPARPNDPAAVKAAFLTTAQPQ